MSNTLNSVKYDQFTNKLVELYIALEDSSRPTQQQLDLMESSGIGPEGSTKFVNPANYNIMKYTINKQDIILDRFNHVLSNNMVRKATIFASPYQIDNELNIDPQNGLTGILKMNSSVVLIPIMSDEYFTGYIAVTSEQGCAAIVQDNFTGESTIHLNNKTSNPELKNFISYYEQQNIKHQTQDSIYVNKTVAEKNAVFELRTGYCSLNEFFKSSFPKETSEIEDFDKVMDRLINKASIGTVSGLYSGDITEHKLKRAAQLENLLMKVYNTDTDNNVFFAVEELFSFKSDKHSKDLPTCIIIETDAIRMLPNDTMNKMDIEPLAMSFFQTADNTMFVVGRHDFSSIRMYRPNEPIAELDNLNNDEHTFLIAEMMYVGQCTTNRPLHDEPEPEPETPKAKSRNKMKI